MAQWFWSAPLLVRTSRCMLLASGGQMAAQIKEKKMTATHKQNRIANAAIRASLTLPMFAQESVATPSKARQDTTHRQNLLTTALIAVLCLLASAVLPSVSRAQAPVFVVTPRVS